MQKVFNQAQSGFLKKAGPLLIPTAAAIAGIVMIILWLSTSGGVSFTERLPAEWDYAQASEDEGLAGPQYGQLVHFDGEPADLPGAWPRFRGANFDAISNDGVALARSWPQDGPTVLWSIDLGEGFAGPVVLSGRVYLIDYDQVNKADAIRCLSLENGEEIWRYSYPVVVKREHGMSRTIPAVTDRYLVTIGPKCHVTCLDPNSGEFRWSLDLVKDFGTTVPDWRAGQCPLIEDGKVIIAPAGDVLMMAVECETGGIVWQTPNPNPKSWKMSHSSIMPVEFMSTRMYIYCTDEAVVGISAEDGTLLWEYLDWGKTLATVPSPLVIGEGRIFLAGGYKAGSMILQLVQQNEKIVAQPMFWPQFHIALEFQKDLNSSIVSERLRRELRKNDIILLTEGVTISTEEPNNRWLITSGIQRYSVRKEQQELIVYTTRLKPEVFDSDQQTPILYQGHIYGIRTPDKQLVCLDLEGNLVWESTRSNRFGDGLGPYSIADGKIYILDDGGTLTLAEANTTGYVQLAQAEVLVDGIEAWGPMAFASGRLLVRDMYRMVCLDITEK